MVNTNGVAPKESPAESSVAPQSSSGGTPSSARASNANLEHALQHGASEKLVENLGHHKIFTWVPTEMGEEHVDLDNEEVALSHGVPRQVLIKSIRKEIGHEEAFLTLPWAILLLIVFSVCLVNHDRNNELRDIEDALHVDVHENAGFAYTDPGNMAHKAIDDAHYTPDIYSFIRIGLAPLLFKNGGGKGWSEGADLPDVSLTKIQAKAYLNYNRVVGGIRLSQTRSTPDTCQNKDVSETYDMKCTPASSTNMNLDITTQPEHGDILKSELQENFQKSLERWFLLDEKADAVLERLRQLESADWIDSSTVHVAVHYLTYNAHFHCLTLNGVHFYQTRTGRLWKKVVQEGAFLDPYEKQWLIAFDIIFVLLVLRLLIMEALDIVHTYRHRLPDSGTDWIKEYLGFWNAVDWISIGFTFALVIMWLESVGKISGLEEELINLSAEEGTFANAISGQSKKEIGIFEGHLDALVLHFEEMSEYQVQFRLLCAIFPMCLMLRLFKAFASQPRLALVTQTLSVSMTDVGHFLVVFFTIFTTFVIMAMLLFGRELAEFSEFGRAFNNCFLALMGDFDYGSMFAEAREIGTVWFWFFQIILVLLMLNMLLAIIMDTYTEVKGASSNNVTLPEQLRVLIRRYMWIRRGEGLHLDKVDEKLEEIYGFMRRAELEDISISYKWEEKDMVTPEKLVELIDGMELRQATRLVTAAVNNWRLDHLDPLSLTEAMNVISLIHRALMDQSKTIAQNHQALVQQTASLGAILEDEEETNSPEQEKVNGSENHHHVFHDRIGLLESDLKDTNGRLDSMEDTLKRIESLIIHGTPQMAEHMISVL